MDDWITMNGTHVLVDDEGNIDKGPEELKSRNEAPKKKVEKSISVEMLPARTDYEYEVGDDKQDWIHKNVDRLQALYDDGGSSAINDEWYKFRMADSTKDVHRISHDEADEVVYDSPYVTQSLYDGWFRNADSSYKPKLTNAIVSTPEMRNAALNLAYENYIHNADEPLGFEEFLVTPIKMYRGGRGQKHTKDDVFSAYTFDRKMAEHFAGPDGKITEAEIKPIDTFGSMRAVGEAEIWVPRSIAPNKEMDEADEVHEDGWEWSDKVKWAFEDYKNGLLKEPEFNLNEELLDSIIRDAEMIELFAQSKGEADKSVAKDVIDRCIDGIQRTVGQMTAFQKAANGDSAFFAGELDSDLGEKEKLYPEHVEAFRERRQKRLDVKEDEGRWITTEKGHKVHLNENGEPDKGNPHVIEKMGEGGAAKKRPAKSVVSKKSSLSDSQRKEYSNKFAALKKEFAEIADFQKHVDYKVKDYDPEPFRASERRRDEMLKGAEKMVEEFPEGTIINNGTILYEKRGDGKWDVTRPDNQYVLDSKGVAFFISGYRDEVDYPPVEFLADSGDAKMVRTIEPKSKEIYGEWADAINSKERKDLVKMAKKDPEFKELVDGIVMYTEGAYPGQRKMAEKIVRDGLDEVSAETIGEMANGGPYEYRDLYKGQDLKSSESSVAGGMVHLIEAINESKPHDGPLYRVAQDRRIIKDNSEVAWEPPKPGEKIEIVAPTSFTSDYEVEKDLTKMKMGDVIHYELESGAHALNVQALSRYKQAEYLCCGKYEVVSVNTETRTSFVRGEPSEAVKKRGIKTNRWGEQYVETYISTIKIRQIGNIEIGKRNDEEEQYADCVGHFDGRMALPNEIIEYRERRKARLDAKKDDVEWINVNS